MVFYYLIETFEPFKIVNAAQSFLYGMYKELTCSFATVNSTVISTVNSTNNGTLETCTENDDCFPLISVLQTFVREIFCPSDYRSWMGIMLTFVCIFNSFLAATSGRTLPGPWIWPSTRVFRKNEPWYLTYHEIARDFGHIFGIRLGLKKAIVVSKYEIVRELFTKDEFIGKPNNAFFKIIGGFGVINTSGTFWSNQRRFLHNCFHAFGMSRVTKNVNLLLEETISSEASALMQELDTRCTGEATDVNSCTAVAVANVITSILMSTRFSVNDNIFSELVNKINEGFRLFGEVNIVQFFPFLHTVSCFNEEFKKIEYNKNETHSFFQTILDEHYVTFDPKKQNRDVLDCYLREVLNTKAKDYPNLIFEDKDANLQIRQVMIDVLTAGMESTNTTIQWCILYMINFPEAAEQVRKELDEVVGRMRLPTFSDRGRLPITMATIYETLRKASVVPLGNPHTVTKDLVWRGYKIPKNTEIVPLIYGINNDEKLWDKPEEFRPSRFINKNGAAVAPKYFMPFGVGKRICMGKSLATMEMFTFFACIMHCYDFATEGPELPSIKANAGVTLYPTAYKVRLTKRKMDDGFAYPDMPTIPIYESSKMQAKPAVL